MNRAVKIVTLLVVIATMVATTVSVVAQDQGEPGPADLVAAIYAAVGQKNIDEAVELLAEDAVLTLIPPPEGLDGTFIGKEEIGGWFEGLAADNGRAEFTNVSEAGNTASMNLIWYGDHFNNLGVAPAEFDGAAVVQGGQLKSVTWVMTPEFIAKMAPALAREANRAAVVRYMEELWNQGDLDVADEVLAEDFVSYNFPEGDREALRESAAGFRAENPNTYFSIDELVLIEGRALVFTTMMERPADAAPNARGKPVGEPMLLVFSVEDGMITGRWLYLWAQAPP